MSCNRRYFDFSHNSFESIRTPNNMLCNFNVCVNHLWIVTDLFLPDGYGRLVPMFLVPCGRLSFPEHAKRSVL